MSRKNFAEAAKTEEALVPVFVKSEKFADRLRDLYQSIRQRAHDLFTARGKEHGHDLEDWFRAEAELLYPVPLTVTESDGNLIVKAEVPGFKPDELELAVAPCQLILSGSTEHTTRRETKDEFIRESHVDEIFRALDLPVEVDPAQVEAYLKKGVLEVTLTKASTILPSKSEAHERE